MRMMRPKLIKRELDLRRLSKEQQEEINECFWERVHKNYDGSSCWRFGREYPQPARQIGKVTWNNRQVSATYFSYALHHGRIEKGMYLWRTCGIANCVNPDHLIYGSHEERESWYSNRPQLTPSQVQEARQLQRVMKIHELKERYQLTDREMRTVLDM